ncbi:MAG TPA: choice-of-anchor Q domain-containing protein, partial [Clostridia bacterium]|nr:choice-of-anchor Q domain-containing protein [Clostridia bacterium]
LKVNPGVTLSITNLILANGRDVGTNGANASAFGHPAENGYPGQGGAILNDGGTVWLMSCVLSNNSVVGGRGGAYAQPYPDNGKAGEGQGGAVFVRNGSLVLESVELLNNSAIGGPGVKVGQFNTTDAAGDAFGGAVYVTNSSVVVAGGCLSSNLCKAPAGGTGAGATAFGGAIFLASGSLVLTNAFLSENLAWGEDSFYDSVGFPRPGSSCGGAVAALQGTVTIEHSQIISNRAFGGNAVRHSGTGEARGGGVFSSAIVVAHNSLFHGNQAVSGNGSSKNTDGLGGACHNSGTAAFSSCSFVLNLASGGNAGAFGGDTLSYPGGHGLGGGICNVAQLALTNCTLTVNSALGGEGAFPLGLPGSGLGGGVFNSNGVVNAVNVTIASNLTAAGKGWSYEGLAGGANVANTNGTLTLLNSILAYPGTNNDAWGTISDAGHNISSDGSANLNSGTSFNFTDPLLRPLGNYGGPTPTMALQNNSPAVDFGAAEGAPLIDQRGLVRPAGLGVDIGACELQSASAQVPPLALKREEVGLRLSFQAQSNVVYHLQHSKTLATWADVELIGPYTSETTVSRTIGVDEQSQDFFRIFLP